MLVLNAFVGFSVGKSFPVFDPKLINDLMAGIISDYLVSIRYSELLNNASHGLPGRPEICAGVRYSLRYS